MSDPALEELVRTIYLRLERLVSPHLIPPVSREAQKPPRIPDLPDDTPESVAVVLKSWHEALRGLLTKEDELFVDRLHRAAQLMGERPHLMIHPLDYARVGRRGRSGHMKLRITETVPVGEIWAQYASGDVERNPGEPVPYSLPVPYSIDSCWDRILKDDELV